jgi:hypothetical protein
VKVLHGLDCMGADNRCQDDLLEGAAVLAALRLLSVPSPRSLTIDTFELLAKTRCAASDAFEFAAVHS